MRVKMISVFKSLFKIIKENTFVISLVSVGLCGLAYLYQVLELQKWEIPVGMVDGMRVQFLLIIVLGLAYCFAASFLHEYLRARFDCFVPTYLVNRFYQENLRKMSKLSSAKNNNAKMKSIEDIKRKCRKLRRDIAGTIILTVLLGAICFLPFYALFFTIVLNSKPLMVIILYSMTIIISIILAYWFNSREARAEIKKLRNEINKTPKNQDAYITACSKIGDLEHARLGVKMKEQDIANNSENSLAVVLTSVIMFILCMVVNLYSSPKKDYWVYTDDKGGNYASVFEAGDSLILKRIDIDGDNVVISLDEQLIIKTVDKPLKWYSFKNVTVRGVADNL